MNKQNFEAINIDVEPTIYVKDKKYTLDEFNQIVDYLASDIELNENQRIVLNQAKINAGTEGSLIKAIHSIYSLNFTPEKAIDNEWAENWIAARKAMCQLSRKEEAEVFAILAEWGMKEVAE